MAVLGRGFFLLLVVCCLTWLGVLWWWQRSAPELQEADLVTYLVVLPVTVFVLVLAIRWAWGGASQRMGKTLSADALVSAPSSPQAAAPADAQERLKTWRLLHASIASPVAEQAEELLEVAEQGEPLPEPDAELLDAQGMPVLTVRADCQDEEMDAVREALAALAGTPWADHMADLGGPQPAWLRAMCLLHRSLLPGAEWLVTWSRAEAEAAGAMADARGSAAAPRHLMRGLLGVDGHWSEAEQRLALQLAQHWWERSLADQLDRWDMGWELVSGSAEALWLRADQQMLSSDRMGRRCWTVMSATSSALDQGVVDQWMAQDCLMRMPQQPRGRVPSEAAVALLLAPTGWAPLPDQEVRSVWLHRPAVSRRSKPIEAPGKVDHQVLAAVTLQALEVAGMEAKDVALLVCDADRHSNRATELYGVTLAHLPHLDPVEDMRLLAAVGGHSGCASALLTVAASMSWVAKQGKACLMLSQGDAHDRMALVMKPDVSAA